MKTEISDVDALTVWQDFGFKLDKKPSSKPAGYLNRLFVSRLRREVEYKDARSKQHHVKKKEVNRVGKLVL